MKDKENKNQLELKSFIQQALVQIVRGVEDAQKKIEKSSAEISPTGLHFTLGDGTTVIYKRGEGIVQTVEFDIGVTVSSEKGIEGEGGIGISVVNIGAKGKKRQEREHINRVKFTVPILLPHKTSRRENRKKGDSNERKEN